MRFDFEVIEKKWQEAWEEYKIFEADPRKNTQKIFATFPYPYMNGPLHVGHGFSSTRVDVYARFKRMMGYNVLFPWAWHWTGETIAGASKRVKHNDKDLIKAFRDIDGVPKELIRRFVDPVFMATYYTLEGKAIVKRMGFSIDWRREFHTTSHDPCFSRFVEWQYLKLMEKGFVIRGSHPVVWCPKCESPTGEADRLVGEDVAPEEYVLIKFRFNSKLLLGATLRPETIYGATNLWINPDSEYVILIVEDEEWIVSTEAAEKLVDQLKNARIVGKISVNDLIGKTCINPVNKQKMFILPGWFVESDVGSGIVYSVPAHAPFDWVALRDLKNKPEFLRNYGIDPKIIDDIKPISLIRLEGFGNFPAIEIVDELKIKNQKDPRLDKATKLVYRKEFHNGVLKDNCNQYAGKDVRDVKEVMIKDFKDNNVASLMYELPSRVVCRCTSSCIVKVLRNQWFLNYSDKIWKDKAHSCVDRAKIYPETVRQWFNDIIDWFREKACARKTGLGTPLPWSPDWIIETLSDSTIYMAYYTISKYVNRLKLTAKQLTDDVFNYIFLGAGNLAEISFKSKIIAEFLKKMREEFLYWYPVDIRNSAKELVPNHLTFFIFHHVALFEPDLWPKMITVNGMVMVEGKKMSKSKGNFVTLKNAIDTFGADPTRCTILLTAEDMDDPNWKSNNVKDIRSKLEAFYDLTRKIMQIGESGKTSHLESWLLSILQQRIKAVSESLEILKTRTAIETALFGIWNDFRWYFRRVDKPRGKILREALTIWIRILTPFIPHLCEEVWSIMNGNSFASLAPWPTYDERKIDINSENLERLIKDVLEDTLNIIKATEISPKKIVFYVSSEWKWQIYLKALKLAEDGPITIGSLMASAMVDSSMKNRAKQISKFAEKIVEETIKIHEIILKKRFIAGQLNEFEILKDASNFFKKEFNAIVEVYLEEDLRRYDPNGRASLAKPYRPAIYIE